MPTHPVWVFRYCHMPYLKERQDGILGAVIREYIRTARPVASADVAHGGARGLSPATIRNELLALDEEGFLEQPHTSAGRVPTDKGYRYFVDHLLAEAELGAQEAAMLREVFAIRRSEEFLHEFTRRVSQIAGAFAAAGMEDKHMFYKSGFSEVLDEPEFSDPARARDFGRLADVMDAEMPRVLPKAREKEQIWIGRENPWREARRYAMTVARWEHPAGFRGVVSIIAPTRTDYSRHKAIIRCMNQE